MFKQPNCRAIIVSDNLCFFSVFDAFNLPLDCSVGHAMSTFGLLVLCLVFGEIWSHLKLCNWTLFNKMIPSVESNCICVLLVLSSVALYLAGTIYRLIRGHDMHCIIGMSVWGVWVPKRKKYLSNNKTKQKDQNCLLLRYWGCFHTFLFVCVCNGIVSAIYFDII